MVKFSSLAWFKVSRRVSHPAGSSHVVVSLKDGTLYCTCNEAIFEGLPYCHQLCIAIKVHNSSACLNVEERWTTKYFEPKDLPKKAELIKDNFQNGSDSEDSEDNDDDQAKDE